VPSPAPSTAPAGRTGIRVDSHMYSGYAVPPYYDSLIAK
jgi:acetyl-CoA carboxylase biotin carboxylase subunit